MTILTGVGGLDMGRVLTRRRGAIVTRGAVGCHAGMIEVGRYPGGGRMAQIAGVVAGDVRRVLACCDGAVVTTETDTDHIRMIHPGNRYPGRVAMAILTYIGRLDVRGVLTRRRAAVMAGHATVSHIGMIKIGRHPATGRMTGCTVIATRYMGRILADRCRTVVTAEAGTEHIGMIHAKHRRPGRIAMAILAHIAGLDVVVALTRRRDTVVTVGAVASNGGVIEGRRHPGCGVVAGFAAIVTLDVGGVLTGRDGAIVATGAGADDISMVDPNHRYPSSTVTGMAILAEVVGQNVRAVLAGRGRSVVAARTVAGHVVVIEVRR